MADNHTRKIMTWRPVESHAAWIKDQAAKRGMRVSEYLSSLIAEEQARQADRAG